VHGDAEDEFVGGLELCDEGIGEREESLLLGGPGVFWGEGGADPGSVEDRELAGEEVAGDYLPCGIGLLPALDELMGEVTSDGGFAEGAGIDKQ